MKFVTRTFIAALVLTGTFASTQISAASTAKVSVARNNALPVPMCAPDDPRACGLAEVKLQKIAPRLHEVCCIRPGVELGF